MGDTQIAQGELSKYPSQVYSYVFFQEHVCVLIYTLLYLYSLMKVCDVDVYNHKVTHNN